MNEVIITDKEKTDFLAKHANEIAEAKKVHKELFLTKIEWKDEKKNKHSILFAFRRPTVDDADQVASNLHTGKNKVFQNLFIDLCIVPHPTACLKEIGDYTGVYDIFQGVLTPFLGLNAIVAEPVVI